MISFSVIDFIDSIVVLFMIDTHFRYRNVCRSVRCFSPRPLGEPGDRRRVDNAPGRLDVQRFIVLFHSLRRKRLRQDLHRKMRLADACHPHERHDSVGRRNQKLLGVPHHHRRNEAAHGTRERNAAGRSLHPSILPCR